jgi:GT2 family glycosyltransferase
MLSVVIVTYNSAACVGKCLDTVARVLPEAERLVVDNASTDASRVVAEGCGATVLGLEKNLGFSRACNVGVRHAQYEHILFLNPDVEICSVDADRLRALLEAPRLGLVVPTSTSSRFIFTERPWWKEALSLALEPLRPRELLRRPSRPRAGQAVWASGASLLTRRAEFLGVGGFDARYFLYYEDRALSWRYRQQDLPIHSTSALVADHAVGGSSEVSERRANVRAFAMIGWIQYRYSVYGRDAATRTWKLERWTQAVITRAVEWVVRIAPAARMRRKALQLREVTQELERICAASGVLEQSDEYAYWPDAVAVLRGEAPEHATPGEGELQVFERGKL